MGPSSAFRWRADYGPTLNAGLVALRFFRGSGPVLLGNPFFVIFQGVGGLGGGKAMSHTAKKKAKYCVSCLNAIHFNDYIFIYFIILILLFLVLCSNFRTDPSFVV